MVIRERAIGPIAQAAAVAAESAIIREDTIKRFVERYTRKQRRASIQSTPEQLSELSENLGREALLVLALKLEKAVGRQRGKGRKGLGPWPDSHRAAFREIFLVSLAGIRGWEKDDRAQFESDLTFYHQLEARSSKGNPAREAFSERAALLLDPSMLERARRSTSFLWNVLGRRATAILTEVLRLQRRRR